MKKYNRRWVELALEATMKGFGVGRGIPIVQNFGLRRQSAAVTALSHVVIPPKTPIPYQKRCRASLAPAVQNTDASDRVPELREAPEGVEFTVAFE